MKRWILRILAVIGGITVLLTILGVVGNIYYAQTAQEAPQQPIAQDAPVTPPTPEELLKRVNIEREKVGVAPLRLDISLNESAQYKSDDLVERQYFGHKDPETGKKNGLDYAIKLAPQCAYVSENLTDADDVEDGMELWVDSPSHYGAIVDPRYNTTGFGITYDGYNYVFVQHFCDLS
jgi:uncharacterized protein YkwD